MPSMLNWLPGVHKMEQQMGDLVVQRLDALHPKWQVDEVSELGFMSTWVHYRRSSKYNIMNI